MVEQEGEHLDAALELAHGQVAEDGSVVDRGREFAARNGLEARLYAGKRTRANAFALKPGLAGRSGDGCGGMAVPLRRGRERSKSRNDSAFWGGRSVTR